MLIIGLIAPLVYPAFVVDPRRPQRVLTPKLDQLSRDAHFLLGLEKAGVAMSMTRGLGLSLASRRTTTLGIDAYTNNAGGRLSRLSAILFSIVYSYKRRFGVINRTFAISSSGNSAFHIGI